MTSQVAGQMAKVKARARPWRSIIALALACCGLAAAETGRHARHLDHPTAQALIWCGSAAFLMFGITAVFGLSGQARTLLQPVIGAAHAGVTRYALVLAGIFTALVVALNLASVPVGQLVLGGAVTGVLLGIAAQQSLSNLFAGMVLLFARPFRVGDRVRFRAGALYGVLEGTVTDISITYVRLETADGVVFIPNSQALAAVVGPLPAPREPAAPAAAAPAPAAPATSAPATSATDQTARAATTAVVSPGHPSGVSRP
jgi:small-conductance mechanosensitive channel